MTLYSLLTAAHGRQLLNAHGWPTTLNVQTGDCGDRLEISGVLSHQALSDLLPALASCHGIDAVVLRGLQLLCDIYPLQGTVCGTVCGGKPAVRISFESFPDDRMMFRQPLCEALQASLTACLTRLDADAETILRLTGSGYEGANIFERETRHFVVVGEVWDALPEDVQPDEALIAAWLHEIFCHGSAVLSVGLVVFQLYGMVRMAELPLEEVIIIRPGMPVRRWLPRQKLAQLADRVRRQVAHAREITASFTS